MRTLKKTLALVLCLAMIAGLCCIGTSAAFADAAEIEKTEAVEVMNALGVLKGDGTNYNPKGILTRAEAAVMLAKLIGEGNVKSTSTYKDMAGYEWAQQYAAVCEAKGFILGDGAGNFFPGNTLTGYQFGLMLCRALGYKPANEGVESATYEIGTAALMKRLGLDKAIANFDGTAGLTRENAAALMLKALQTTMVSYSNGGTTITGGGFTITTGASAAAAQKWIGTEGVKLAGGLSEADDTKELAEVYFPKLVMTANTFDKYGRPATAWTYDSKPVGTYASMAPVFTYVKGFDANELKALQAAGYTFEDVIYVNGGLATNSNNASNDTVAELAAKNYAGNVIEMYATDITQPKNIDRIVLVTEYLTKVTSVVSTNIDPTKNSITLAVYNPWADNEVVSITFEDDTSTIRPSDYDILTAKYAKDDYLITAWKFGDVKDDGVHYIGAKDITSTEVATVSSTKLSSSLKGTVIAGDKTFTMHDAYAEHSTCGGTPTIGKEYTFYMDANGYVMGAVATDPTVPVINYGIVLDYDCGNYIPASNVGNLPAQAAYENIEIFTSEGKAVVYGTAFTTNAYGVVTPVVGDSANDNGTLVAYKLNAAGKLVEIAAAAGTLADSGDYLTSGHEKGDAFTYETTNYASSATVTFVLGPKSVSTDDNPETFEEYAAKDIAAYVGYANVPDANYTLSAAIAPAIGGAGACAATVSALPDANTLPQFVVFTDVVPVVEATETIGINKYTFNVVLDGKATTVFYLGASLAVDADRVKGELKTITFSTVTGEVTGVEDVGESATKMTVIESGFFAGSDVIYTDAKTVFYKLGCIFDIDSNPDVDALTGFAAVDSIEKANVLAGETFETYEYYVVDANSDDVAEVVFYYVYQP